MNNKVLVKFNNNECIKHIGGLTQWDYGLILEVNGLELEESTIEVHFSLNETAGDALRGIATVKDNVLTTTIPSAILQAELAYNYNAYAFIYITSAETGKTVKKIVFNITARPKPADWIPPEEPDTLGQVLDQINKKVDKEEGKGLSSNDYTDEEKNKLKELPTNADLAESLDKKATKENTLEGYGIKDAYTKKETDELLSKKANAAKTLEEYGIENAYTKKETDDLLEEKANKGTTLSDYGIKDAYTKTEIDKTFDNTNKNIDNASQKAQVAEEIALECEYRVGKLEIDTPNNYANAVKATASGEVIRVDDVSPIEHTAKVNIRGKNLLPFTAQISSINGTTYIIGDDGSIKIDKKPNTGFYLTIGKWETPIMLKGEYTISIGTPLPVGSYFYIKDTFGNKTPLITYYLSGATNKTYTLNGTYNEYGLWVSIDSTYNNHTFYPMLEEGNEATEYEPYINPTTVKITSCGKNLFNITNHIGKTVTNNGITVDILNDGCIYVHGKPIDTTTATSITISHSKAVDVFPKGTYVYGNNPLINDDSIYCFPQANKPSNKAWIININKQATYVTEEFCMDRFVVYVKEGTTKEVNAKFYLQVGTGEEVGNYEKYKTVSTYTPAADGTVNIGSVAPTMTLLTDTEGVNIECEYNQDTNKALGNVNADLKELDRVTAELSNNMGDVETALNNIIDIQNSYIGGVSV